MTMCGNCGRYLVGGEPPTRVSREVHCALCAALAAAQTVNLPRRQGQHPGLALHACRRCGLVRASTRRALTRCPVCVDERYLSEAVLREQLEDAAPREAEPWSTLRRDRLAQGVYDLPGTARRDMTLRTWAAVRADETRRRFAHNGRPAAFATDRAGETTFVDTSRDGPLGHHARQELDAHLELLGTWRLYERPGWKIVASEQRTVRGPSGNGSGVWGTHHCGHLRQMTLNPVMRCQPCGETTSPPPSWPLHRHLLYLVAYDGGPQIGTFTKLGIGNLDRVREHLTWHGTTVAWVLEAPIAEVREAETLLKQRLRRAKAIVGAPLPAGLPGSFGWGTEVVEGATIVDLREVLPFGEDVTDIYLPYFTAGLNRWGAQPMSGNRAA